MKIIQNTRKIVKNLRCMKNIWSMPHVGFPETRHFIGQTKYCMYYNIFSYIVDDGSSVAIVTLTGSGIMKLLGLSHDQ